MVADVVISVAVVVVRPPAVKAVSAVATVVVLPVSAALTKPRLTALPTVAPPALIHVAMAVANVHPGPTAAMTSVLPLPVLMPVLTGVATALPPVATTVLPSVAMTVQPSVAKAGHLLHVDSSARVAVVLKAAHSARLKVMAIAHLTALPPEVVISSPAALPVRMHVASKHPVAARPTPAD